VFGLSTSESTKKQEKRGDWLAAHPKRWPEGQNYEEKNGGFKTAIRLLLLLPKKTKKPRVCGASRDML
jgi:hypothetical protein